MTQRLTEEAKEKYRGACVIASGMVTDNYISETTAGLKQKMDQALIMADYLYKKSVEASQCKPDAD